MTDLYKNKYRIPSARLQVWDYGSPGAYFITICTQNRICWFGKIIKARMILSDMGRIVHQYWHEIPCHFNHVELGPFIVMPNHVHGILILKDSGRDAIDRVSKNENKINKNSIDRVSNNENKINKNSIDRSVKVRQRDAVNSVSTGGGVTGDKNPMLNNSISKIVRWYKGKCTYQLHKLNQDVYFQWQARFYDHIIRNEQDYHRISEYIINNPAQWEDDKYYEEK